MPKLTPAEAAKKLGTDPQTLAKSTRLSSIRTPGGQRRYDADEVEKVAAFLDAARKTR